MHRTQQRAFILGAILEFVGILGLAFRFGAAKGGLVLVMLAGTVLVIGMVLQVRAIVQARTQPMDNETVR